MTTKELFDAYFESKGYGVKTRVSVDRAEVYDMEEKLGKPFIEFTPDECIELLKSFRGGKQFSLNSYTTWVSVYRKIFNFYSDFAKRLTFDFSSMLVIYGFGILNDKLIEINKSKYVGYEEENV